MRATSLLFLFTVIFFHCYAQQFSSQWQWLNPKPSGFNNVKVCFSDSNNGYIFNDQGDLINTTDGGNHWSIQQNFTNAKAMDLRDSTGIIAGFSNSVFISTDKGKSWHKKVISSFENPYIPFVQVISRDTIIAVNSNNYTLYRSTDRGLTWTAVLTNTILNNNLCIHFINSKIGFIGGYGGIYKTSDGGATWQTIYNSSSWGITAIRFLNESIGIAFRADDQLLRTTDGGITWTSTSFYFNVNSIFIVNANIIYASGEQSRIYKSTNSGVSWNVVSPQVPNPGYYFNSIYFLDDNKGFVVGTSGKILSTSDGGTHWLQYGVTHTPITSFHLPTNKVAYASDWWSVYKSTDGGLNWQYANLTLSNLNSRFTHCWFRNKDTGFFISQSPVLFYRTYDGGQTWQSKNPLPAGYDDAVSLNFVNDSVGYLCLDNYSARQIYSTTDGGETWKLTTTSYNGFTQMDFVNATTGYAVNDHHVFRTTDSAKTWTLLFNSDYENLNGVHFLTASTGYCFGDNGFMRKTIDSGTTWSKINVPYGHIVNTHFFNEQVGYLYSETYNGGISKTYDSGKTWHHQIPVSGLHMISTTDTVMFVAGYAGEILAQTIADYDIDSLTIKNITPCSADFSAYVSAAFSHVDSIKLEYGIDGFTQTLNVLPSSVSNGTLKIIKTIQNLTQDTNYTYRLKCFYKGNYIYSEDGSFRTQPLPKPTITIKNDTLISSSYFNNQWFFNAQPISGANDRQLKATNTGKYTVQVSESGCLSEMSDSINFVVTAIVPVLSEEISISPNPVTDRIYVHNKNVRGIEISVTDVMGNIIYSARSNDPIIEIRLKQFANGIYIVTVSDNQKRSFVREKIIKL